MKMNEMLSKTAVVFVIAAAGALIAGSASAAAGAEPVARGGGAGQPGAGSVSVNQLLGSNGYRTGCVRFYVQGRQYDVLPQKSFVAQVERNHSYMASVFRGACGGAAVKNVWYRTPSTSSTTWWNVAP
ncbi:MAG TPA: signal peptidase [Duganella sp.]|uniref:signal peptidase n=1 Tax=Duganella sp. TaxID=1904440 RepID=UPI002ED32467